MHNFSKQSLMFLLRCKCTTNMAATFTGSSVSSPQCSCSGTSAAQVWLQLSLSVQQAISQYPVPVQVHHECGWGCHGYFEPARYNSSRAKCIKCGYCSVYFSPNKFIFHFHRTPDAKYHHPDAANFNSWRRHLKLVGTGNEDEAHVWEDVKAMFNGGTRKRIFSSSPRTSW